MQITIWLIHGKGFKMTGQDYKKALKNFFAKMEQISEEFGVKRQ
jgi:hypothetical protein